MTNDLANQKSAWHALDAQESARRLESNVKQGLSQEEAKTRLTTFGPNRLPEGANRGPWMRFLQQFDNILVYVLLAAGFVKLMLGLWLDASIITGVVVVNAVLGFLQEGKAEQALDSIRNMLSADARALRDSQARIVPAEDLVPGDIVLLESGDRVPADLRLIDVKNLRTDEAALTGESVPADKATDAVPQNSTVGDRANMAFSGTLVVSGRATGVVVATGADTELGRINQMLASVDALETPLLRQIEEFGHTIAKVIGFVSVAVFAYARWVRDLSFVEAFQAVVGIAVSVIPEGLPALITITLATGVQRMAQRNAIIRRLPAVETLGSVSRICSDKTGTLTLMEMMVSSAVTSSAGYKVTGDGYATEGDILLGDTRAPSSAALQGMGVISALCNDSELRLDGGVWKAEGDPTEAALYPFAAKMGLDRDGERERRRRIDVIPFESEHKFMATLHEESGGGRLLLVKGAPEVIIAHCDRQEGEGGAEALRREYWAQASDRLAEQGERVLALAWLHNPTLDAKGLSPEDLPKNLILLGIVGLMDPPRKEAVEAVAECHRGGIRVTMITGDHKITAAAIAKMLGIGDGKTAVSGAEIEAMNDGALQEAVRNVDVFARASPEHKLRLVKAIQANGQVVAMTGDGVNDAPALKRADIGVAMGIKGAEVTKEAAAMVLADDNFASITAAVREGRTVYNNIEKALLFMLPTNVAQALVILVAIVAGFILPITAPQILWVNMVTSVALGLVISFEPHELDVMLRRPRAVSQPILDGFAMWRVIFVGASLLVLTLAAFFWMKSSHASDELARTVAVNTLVIGQIFYLLNSRFKTDSSLSLSAHLGNRYLPMGIAAVIVLQALFTYAGPLQRLFGTTSVPAHIWPWLLLGGMVFFLVVEIEKLIIRKFILSRPVDSLAQSGGGAYVAKKAGIASPHAPSRWQAAVGALAVLALIAGEVALYWRQSSSDLVTATVVKRDDSDAHAPKEALARISGRLAAVSCEKGVRVSAGQLCAKIDPSKYEKALAEYKAALKAALLREEASALAVKGAKSDLARFELSSARAKGRALDKAKAALASAERRAVEDRSEVQRARAAVAATEAALSLTDIAAPITGVILASADVGVELVGGEGPPAFAVSPIATLLIPKEAVDYGKRRMGREQGLDKLPDGWSFVWILREGQAGPVRIRLGSAGDDYFEVLESSLAEGDQVVVDDRSR